MAWTSDRTGASIDAQLDKVDQKADQAALDAGLAEKANVTALTAHTGATDNPHGTTKAQIGLGDVANLAPSAMPISSAQQKALDDNARETETATIRFLLNDGVPGWVAAFVSKAGVIGGWKDRAGTFMMRTFRTPMNETSDLPDSSAMTPLAKDMAGKTAIGVLGSGQTFIHDILAKMRRSPPSDLPDNNRGTAILRDKSGKVSLSQKSDGSLFVWRFTDETIKYLAKVLADKLNVNGQLFSGVPGYNHRSFDADHYLITMPTMFGPVDVVYPKSGTGLAFAATNDYFIILSCSGQSNTLDGGGFPDLYGYATKGIYDRHRAFEPDGHRHFGDGSGSPAPWQSGDITALAPAGRDFEQGGINQWTPDVIQFSAIANDQYAQRAQQIYVQVTTAEGGTPLIEYLPGTTKGDSIQGSVEETATMIQSVYGRKSIMYSHFLIGHENETHTGYDSYSDVLTAFVNYVCGFGEDLPGNVEAGVRPKVLAYQPNDATTEALGDIKASALETLSLSFTNPDLVCIGPVYHERTTDDGIHMVGKFMTAELFAHVHDIIRDGGDYKPLHAKRDGSGNIVSAIRTGTTIEIIIEGPNGILEFDQDWLNFALESHGLKYVDDTSSASIAAVELYSYRSYQDRKIIITLDQEPTGTNPKIVISGVENTTDEGHPGGMTDIYVTGRPSFWHPYFPQYTTSHIRHYLCRDIVPVTTA
ncbi:hypothetical protein JET14_13185 [Martelella lutilitoris]|uniref:Uncharacterized protein n=1 Tax=Martelella lutilitoris TaxID=2583532 RepID=A0A7T7HHH5_9HYPH|nr:hypothetical protein [Martelella lutilitoris]QQM29281.1 hypothetical protein JET14_13185 [Martelella lutilitoris]